MEMIWKAVLMLLLAHLVLGVVLWYRVRNLYRYPNALGFPVIGNLYYFYRTYFVFTMPSAYDLIVATCNAVIPDGEVYEFGFQLLYGSSVCMAVLSPEFSKKLSFHPNLADKPKPFYEPLHCLASGPFAKIHSDSEWKVVRKDYNNSLKKSRVDNDYYSFFIRGANKMVEAISTSPSSGFDAHAVLNGFILDVSLKSLHGFETDLVHHHEVSKFYERINELTSFLVLNRISAKIVFLIQPILSFILGKKVMEIRKLVVDVANDKSISNRSPSNPPGELPLSVHLASRHIKNDTSEKILMELTELLLTSGHTVSSTLSNTICFLATLPDIQERAWQEQNEIFGDDKRDPTIEDINQMHFLDRFIKESLRFLGPTFIARHASADIILDEVTIPRDTIVIFMLRYMRFNPNFWKNPNIFDPDRFLEESDSLKYSYTTFGIGIRYCPGIYYATIFMKIILSRIIRRLKLRPVEKGFRFEDLKLRYLLLAEVENPPKLHAEERR